MEKVKKLFGGINFTWKKLIIFAVIAGVYTAIMATLPIVKDTSFEDISVRMEWWILFGIIIISNSKSPKDSALKCFVFFLISQPLVYLIQVPFASMGWGLFKYYKRWFIMTLGTIPMGFIGYYIKKKNVISMIILLPMLILLSFIGLGYFTTMIDSFPHHLLSFIACFLIIIMVVLNLFDKNRMKIITLSIVTIISIIIIVLKGGIVDSEYETYKTLDNFEISFVGNIIVSDFTGTSKGYVEIITCTDEIHSIKINGRKKGKYEFAIKDEADNEYYFEYYFDPNTQAVELNKKESEDLSSISNGMSDEEQISNVATNNAEQKGDALMDTIHIKVNDKVLDVKLENNSSAQAFFEKLKDGDLAINAHDYGKFEKVGKLGFSLPTNDISITTQPGDLILYQGNQISLYYDINTWTFTKLGKVVNLSKQELKDILGSENTTLVFSVK